MIDFRIEGNLGPLIDYIHSLSEVDFTPLGDEIAQIAVEDNRRARAAGLDKDGAEVKDLGRAGRHGIRRPLRFSEYVERGGFGPALAPRGADSRIVTGFVAEVLPNPEGGIIVRGSWPGLDWVQFHVRGGSHLPRRDPTGVTPEGMDRIADAVRRFLRDKLGLY